jgi:hypothetical protein
MYRLLANVRGEGALYPPRGLPSDAGDDACRAYYHPVVETEAEVLRGRGRVDAVTRADAEYYVVRGWSEWLESNGVQFINNPEYHHASWLTAAEFRHVVDYYIAHKLDFLQQRHLDILTRDRESMSDEEYQRRLATPDWDTSVPPEQWLHGEFRMLLAAIEAGTACGYQVRLVFWFHG